MTPTQNLPSLSILLTTVNQQTTGNTDLRRAEKRTSIKTHGNNRDNDFKPIEFGKELNEERSKQNFSQNK